MSSPAGGARRVVVLAAVVLAVAWAWTGLDIDLDRLDRAGAALDAIVHEFWPPELGRGALVWDAIVETVQMAVLATVFGTAIAIPLGLVAARTVFPAWVAVPARLAATAVRVVPILIWALLAVITLGQGPFAGVVALTFYTVGYLTKLQSESIEGIPRDALDAVRAMGAPRYQQAWHVVLPEAANALRSQVLFMFEYNVRSSSIVGFVGAGGLGVLLDVAREFRDYDRITAYVLALFVVVVAIDGLSYLLRRRYVEHAEGGSGRGGRRARFRDVLAPFAAGPSEPTPPRR